MVAKIKQLKQKEAVPVAGRGRFFCSHPAALHDAVTTNIFYAGRIRVLQRMNV
jgi:hypothetical protein